jgi:diguanylate cyclase (GGDEF)-like protein
VKRVLEHGQTAWSYFEPWSLVAVGLVGAIAVMQRAFESAYFGTNALIMAILLSVATTWDVRNRFLENRKERPHIDFEGPLLWIVSSWALLSALGTTRGELFLFGAALIAWVYVTQPRVSAWTALGVCAVMEVGLAWNGAFGLETFVLRAVALSACCLGLERFSTAEAFRVRLGELREQNDRKAVQTERARDFGLLTAQAPIIDALPSLGGVENSGDHDSLKFLDDSFGAVLEVLRASLNATSAVILWRTSNGLSKSAHVSLRDDIMDGPFHLGRGLPASVLGEVSEVAQDQVRENFEGLPYYAKPGGVGSAFAIAIGAVTTDADREPLGVLCIDRSTPGAWPESERAMLRAVARKIALDVYTSQRLKAAENEKSMVRRFCAALGELNKALGIEGAAQATFEAVQEMANADLMAITLAGDFGHRVVAARGERAAGLMGRQFDGKECLVGKAVEIRQTLPLSGRYRGHGTVFVPGEALGDMQSLMVIPLVLPAERTSKTTGSFPSENTARTQESEVVGTLTVAAQSADAFRPPARDMIQLIARQIAIKLDLADAHEQIREMAKTDPMTGLANDRSFDNAFSNMLSRAERRSDSVALIMIDIDKFKTLNDTYGHPFGDEVIKAVAKTLQMAVRSVDLAARIGGEEFALLIEDTGVEGAHEIAERVRLEIENMVLQHPEKGPVTLTLSMGIAEFPAAGRDQVIFMSHADKFLYFVKNSG